ncbi:hypothetical protein [Phenylobacterium sp.]|uniref:hypothetical protein n=1 Tax=Phenylobacterium sp. TaxID=1871053 RepID=UPI0025DEB999|nr:hypothetical protein [Phenylobacterium sp.]
MPAPREPHPDQAPPERRPSKEASAKTQVPDEGRSFDTDAPPGGYMGSGGDPAEGKHD